MVENSDTPSSTLDFMAQIAVLTTQVQENANRFMALKDESATLGRDNHNLLDRLSTVETTPSPEL